MTKSEAIQVRFYKAKKLPSAYFATEKELDIPALRIAKPSAYKNRYGTYKSGKILSVRYYE
jgi:hypothetical protein